MTIKSSFQFIRAKLPFEESSSTISLTSVDDNEAAIGNGLSGRLPISNGVAPDQPNDQITPLTPQRGERILHWCSNGSRRRRGWEGVKVCMKL